MGAQLTKTQVYSSYPASGLDHHQLQGVSEGLILKERHRVTAGQAREHVPVGQKPGVRNHLGEPSRSPLHHSPHIEAVLCQGSCLEELKVLQNKSTKQTRNSARVFH